MLLHDDHRSIRFNLNEEVEDVLALTATNSQHAMRGNLLYRLLVVVIHFELFLLVHRIHGFAAHYHAFIKNKLTQRLAQVGVFTDPFGDNVARAFKRLFHSSHAQFRIHKRCGKCFQRLRSVLLCPEILRQRLKPFFARDGGLGAALRLIRKIPIFELVFVERSFNARLELIGQLALLGNGREDGLAPLRKVTEVSKLFLNVTNLDFVQVACGFLAITRNEWNGAAIIKQFNHGNDAAYRQIQRLSNVGKNFGREVFCFFHGQSLFIVHASRDSSVTTDCAKTGMAGNRSGLPRITWKTA
jgi:hypothetical protein